MCRVLGVAPSGYYRWIQQPISNRGQEDARLLRVIRASFIASQGIYCSKHRVARLMRENKLRALHGGAVPALTNVLIINAGSGEVASFQAGNDGAMAHTLTASIRDRLIVTITDPQGRVFSFQRSTYVAADGTTGVGSGGGRIKSPTSAVTLPQGVSVDDVAATAGLYRRVRADKQHFELDQRPPSRQ